MLATLAHEPFSDPEWIYERKLDGVRCLVFCQKGEVRLVSRNRKNMNATWPELVETLGREPCRDFLADGEIVAFEVEQVEEVEVDSDPAASGLLRVLEADATLERLAARLERMERRSSPFAEPVREKGAHWVSPKLVGELGFTEWTEDGKLRHPRFLGLRTDKEPSQVHRERPEA